jgi:hypothetical protein
VPSGATEPITLTDPDGAVTRVAPWSSWTREQVRAPGGEPALVTRLDQGQLWFSAGRRRSPWRHEVHVGPAVVSTPRGRFQAVAEPDGGATIACLAGRTRVVAGLREPVLLGPDQSAAVSSDGRTLVVMDRASGTEITDPEIIDLTAEEHEDAEVPELATVAAGSTDRPVRPAGAAPLPAFDQRPPESPSAPEPLPYHDEPSPARLGWIPELVAVLAVVGLLVAGVWVFRSRDGAATETAAPPTTSMPITTEPAPPTTGAPATTEAPTTTGAPTTTQAPTTTVTTRPPAATGATAVGELQGCRRGGTGVIATVSLSHRSGPASTFSVSAALVDPAGAEFARGAARSELIQPGGTGSIDVPIAAAEGATGSCELREVTSS